jgi:hypothetical protein
MNATCAPKSYGSERGGQPGAPPIVGGAQPLGARITFPLVPPVSVSDPAARCRRARDGAGRQPVIVVDEAHLLKREMLEEVRFLLNFDVDSRAPLALLLAGQPELRTTLKLACFAAIAQRVSLRAHLPPLTPAESAQYLQHHLA